MLKRLFLAALLGAATAGAHALAPKVSLTAPANNTSVVGPATLTLRATATDADGRIARVQFYRGTTLLGTDTTAPYAYTWSNVPVGNYKLTAKATDNSGAVATSAVVNLNVNVAPTISLTAPANQAVYTAPARITLAATAADRDGTVAKVTFYAGATLLGTDTVAPYSFTWSNVPAGTYALTARVTDNRGASKTSNLATVTVKPAPNSVPTVSLTAPAGSQTYAAPATIPLSATATDSNGSIRQVAFYANGTFIGAKTTPPYTIDWPNVPAGSYSLTAVATDNAGATATSGAVTVNVINNSAPTVSISAGPPSGPAPATVALTATAADSDGSIAKVELYDGATLLATLTQAPYSYSWTDVGAGTHSVTAKAIDNLGAATVSATVAVAVEAPPVQAYYIYSDHLNTPRLITDSGNNTVWQWDQSDPFGNNVPTSNPGFEFNLRMPGQYFDRETGLHYNVHRDYDPSIGRYIQSDPIGLKGGQNTYLYGNANPISYTDPTGLCPWCFFFAALELGIVANTVATEDVPIPGGGLFKGASAAGGAAVCAAKEVAQETAKVGELIATHGKTMSNKQLDKLIKDIRANGIKEPLTVTSHEGKTYILDGHHRALAAPRAGVADVPVNRVELPFGAYKSPADLTFTPGGY